MMSMVSMKRLPRVLPLSLLWLALAAPSAANNDFGGYGPDDHVDVMSQNQYLGADLGEVIAATDPISFNAALVEALQTIAASEPAVRAERLALLIAWRGADLVGQQEVFRFECFDIPLPGPDCSDPSVAAAFTDHLTDVQDELDDLGRPYTVAGIVEDLDITGVVVPGLPPGLPVDLNFDGTPDFTVTVLDRDVILARDGIPTSVVPFPCSFPSADGCRYSVVATVNSPIGPLDVARGFVGVDAEVRGRTYRFVNTHLEVMSLIPPPPGPLPPTPPGVELVFGGSIQAAQSTELAAQIAASLALTPPPPGTRAIAVGDINSSPEDGPFIDPLFDPTVVLTPPYAQLAQGVDLFGAPAPGPWTDAWTALPGHRPGYTCCQDADLRNRRSALDERIDVVFTLDPPHKVRHGMVLGSTPFSKIRPLRIWPSDHGQPAVQLRFRRNPH